MSVCGHQKSEDTTKMFLCEWDFFLVYEKNILLKCEKYGFPYFSENKSKVLMKYIVEL